MSNIIIGGCGSGKTYRIMLQLVSDETLGLLVPGNDRRRDFYSMLTEYGIRYGKISPMQVNDIMKRVFVSPDQIIGTSIKHIAIDDIGSLFIANRPVSFVTANAVEVVKLRDHKL